MPIPSPRLVMLGAAPETRGSIAAVVDAYRAHGLFERWPVEYLPLRSDGGARQRAALAARALRDFAWLALRNPRSALHLHTRPGAGFWRETSYPATRNVCRNAAMSAIWSLLSPNFGMP